jgi:hypothetical protein
MRRVLPFPLTVFLPFLLVAGCVDYAPPAAGPTPQVRVGFPPGGVVDTIVVNAIDRLPLRAAELVAPNGAVTAASYIDAAASPNFATGQWVAGDPWQSMAGNTTAAALTLQNPQAGAGLQGRQQLLATVSTADILLPDPVAYRRDWPRYRVRLTFGTPPDIETRLLAAPQPPPAAR